MRCQIAQEPDTYSLSTPTLLDREIKPTSPFLECRLLKATLRTRSVKAPAGLRLLPHTIRTLTEPITTGNRQTCLPTVTAVTRPVVAFLTIATVKGISTATLLKVATTVTWFVSAHRS